MKNSVILLALALLLLYLAVTDRLSRLFNAWDAIRGKNETSVRPTGGGGAAIQSGTVAFNLPTLPPLANLGKVGL